MSVMTRGGFPVTTVVAGIKKVYFQSFANLRELYTSVFNESSSTRGFEDFVKTSGIGRMLKINENESVPYDSAVEGDRKIAVHDMYALGFQVSRVLLDDEQYGTMRRMSEALARSVRYEQEVQAWALINDAFDGSTFTGFDGLALCHTAHTLLKSSSTFSNELASDLTASSLEAAIDLFALAVDDSNMNIALEPRVLLTAAQGRWQASRLTESPYDPEVLSNAKNPLADVGLSWFASPYITDADHWFILSEKSQHDLMFIWRMKPETEDTVDFDTKSVKFSAIQRFKVHFNEPRGVVGSSGT